MIITWQTLAALSTLAWVLLGYLAAPGLIMYVAKREGERPAEARPARHVKSAAHR